MRHASPRSAAVRRPARLALAALVLLAPAFAAATPPLPPAGAGDPAVRGEAAMADLGRSLREALGARMQAGGPVEAIAFCHDEAPGIAEDVARRHGVRIGRVGVRVRNPGNAAEGWQAAMLEDFQRRAAAGEGAATLRHVERDAAAGVLRLGRGIPTEPACLACHGPALAPPVAAAIAARYPADAATGFLEGQLRGAMWVEVALPPAATAASGDARAAIPLTVAQQARMMEEMRAHLEAIERILAGLAADDWDAVAAAAAQPGPVAADPARPGADFRRRLPPGWFALAQPMHAAFAAIAAEAADARRVEVVVAELARASGQCTACHATFRLAPEDAPAGPAPLQAADLRAAVTRPGVRP